jgi:hypothetical protein
MNPYSPTNDDTKCVVVIDEALSLGLIANTAAVLALTLGSRLDIVGADLCDRDGARHKGLTRIPIPILKAPAHIVSSVREAASSIEDLFLVDVSDAAQTTTNYEDYEEALADRGTDDLQYLGVALFGAKRAVNRLTGSLPLLR